jgi:hypothetical protein
MVKHTPMMIEFDMYSKSNMYNRFKKNCPVVWDSSKELGRCVRLEVGYIDKMQYVI